MLTTRLSIVLVVVSARGVTSIVTVSTSVVTVLHLLAGGAGIAALSSVPAGAQLAVGLIGIRLCGGVFDVAINGRITSFHLIESLHAYCTSIVVVVSARGVTIVTVSDIVIFD